MSRYRCGKFGGVIGNVVTCREVRRIQRAGETLQLLSDRPGLIARRMAEARQRDVFRDVDLVKGDGRRARDDFAGRRHLPHRGVRSSGRNKDDGPGNHIQDPVKI